MELQPPPENQLPGTLNMRIEAHWATGGEAKPQMQKGSLVAVKDPLGKNSEYYKTNHVQLLDFYENARMWDHIPVSSRPLHHH